jgi:hypothetical protein
MQRHSNSLLQNVLFLKVALLITLIFFCKVSVAEETQKVWLSDWEEESADEGFKAQCRMHKTEIKQCIFKARTRTSLDALSAVVHDVNNFTLWADSVAVSKHMPEFDQGKGLVVYTEYSVSGAYDRYAVTRYQTETKPVEKTVRVTFKTIDEKGLSPDLRLIRFPLMAGYWQFKTLSNGETEIEHKSFTLPGGAVQKTLHYFYNIAYLEASYETIRNLIKVAQTQPYASAEFEWPSPVLSMTSGQ